MCEVKNPDGKPENIYRWLPKSNTLLHTAIARNDEASINRLLAEYKKDFKKVENFLRTQFCWNSSDQFWLNKNILIAVNEDQCRTTIRLESKHLREKDLRAALIILLKVPINEQEVAVIHPVGDKNLEGFRLVKSLLKNGVLSWNSTGPEGKCDSFAEKAILFGRKRLFKQLIELGADLNLRHHNPLLAACRSHQVAIVRWLLTEYFGCFDPTTRDRGGHNALMIAMQRKNEEMFDFLVDRMVAFREKYSNESQSEALTRICLLSDGNISNSISILNSIDIEYYGKVIEEKVIKYGIDLNYQIDDKSILSEFLYNRVAFEYCLSRIEMDPLLLDLKSFGGTKIIHILVTLGQFDFLEKIYRQCPHTKTYYNMFIGLQLLREGFEELDSRKIAFICDHHVEFLMSDADLLKKNVLLYNHYSGDKSQMRYDLMIERFETFRSDIETIRQSHPIFRPDQELQTVYEKLFSPGDGKITTEMLENVRGHKGQTILQLAVEKNDLQTVERILNAGFDSDLLDEEGNHAIHYVKSVGMFNSLIEQRPDVEKIIHRTNLLGYTVFHRICALGIVNEQIFSLLERLIECGADVNQPTVDGETAVFMIGNQRMLNILRKHGANLHMVNNDGKTVLYKNLLCRNSHFGVELLKLIRSSDSFRDTAHAYLPLMTNLSRAIFNTTYQRILEEYPETTKLLFDSVYYRSRECASSLFNKVCAKALNFCVKKFLDYDYDLDWNLQDEGGHTPIMWLLSYLEERNIHLVERLLKKGVNLNIQDSQGRTALLALVSGYVLAQWCGHGLHTVKLLIEHEADVKARDNQGNSVLHYAFERNELDLVELLVECGGDLRVKNNTGKYPYEMGNMLYRELLYFTVT